MPVTLTLSYMYSVHVCILARNLPESAKIQHHGWDTRAPCKVSLSGLYSTKSIKIQHHAQTLPPNCWNWDTWPHAKYPCLGYTVPSPSKYNTMHKHYHPTVGIGTPGPMQSIPVWAIQYRVHQNTTPCTNTTTQLLELGHLGPSKVSLSGLYSTICPSTTNPAFGFLKVLGGEGQDTLFSIKVISVDLMPTVICFFPCSNWRA